MIKDDQKKTKAGSRSTGQRYCPNCGSEFQGWVKFCIDCGTELTDEKPSAPPDRSRQNPEAPDKSAAHSQKAKPENLVTIATFITTEQAHLSRAKLESEGIWSFVADENLPSVCGSYVIGVAFGGIRLQVRESDAEEAIQILKEVEEKTRDFDKSAEKHCPECNSEDIQNNPFSVSRILISILLLGFPIPFFKRRWKCKNCGHEWTPEKKAPEIN